MTVVTCIEKKIIVCGITKQLQLSQYCILTHSSEVVFLMSKNFSQTVVWEGTVNVVHVWLKF